MFDPPDTPEVAIHKQLHYETYRKSHPDKAIANERFDFFYTLGIAWDALAFNKYEIGSDVQSEAGSDVSNYSGQTEKPTEMIKLNPTQTRMINALAEVAGIPYKRGQNQIPIPEKLQGNNYANWIMSDEYMKAYDAQLAKRRGKK